MADIIDLNEVLKEITRSQDPTRMMDVYIMHKCMDGKTRKVARGDKCPMCGGRVEIGRPYEKD